MNCRLIESRLDDYLDATLPEREQSELEQHIAKCSACAQTAERAFALKAVLAELPVEGPQADFFERALTNAASARGIDASGSMVRRYFLGAIAAGIAALVAVLMLNPATDPVSSSAGIAQVALAVEESRTINLVFASNEALDDVSLIVELPAGVELAMYPGQSRIQWSTRLQQGKNVLPLQLVALGGSGGELVATLRGSDREKVFKIDIEVLMG